MATESPITARRKDFPQWYQDVIRQGDLAEPAEVVRGWKAKADRRLDRLRGLLNDSPSAGTRLAVEAILELADDPFQGCRERRIMPEGMKTTDMESAAAREAIKRAGLDASANGGRLSPPLRCGMRPRLTAMAPVPLRAVMAVSTP